MVRRMDLTGDSYGMLTVLSFSHTDPSNSMSYYLCKCSCGTAKVISHGHLRSGHTKSCGCAAVRKGKSNPMYKHGVPDNHKTYLAWRSIKTRCYNENSSAYKNYGLRGILMADEFVNDFEAFYREVGDAPDTPDNWSIDRIDHKKGYIKGNMRWANSFTQARNKGKSNANTSGFSGVSWWFRSSNKRQTEQTYALAQWMDLGGRKKCKYFSVKKYGLLPAFKMACEYRDAMIAELNVQGAGYTENHGKI